MIKTKNLKRTYVTDEVETTALNNVNIAAFAPIPRPSHTCLRSCRKGKAMWSISGHPMAMKILSRVIPVWRIPETTPSASASVVAMQNT